MFNSKTTRFAGASLTAVPKKCLLGTYEVRRWAGRRVTIIATNCLFKFAFVPILILTPTAAALKHLGSRAAKPYKKADISLRKWKAISSSSNQNSFLARQIKRSRIKDCSKLLCSSVNIASPEDLWKRRDYKKACEFADSLNGSVASEVIDKSKLKGSIRGGVCFGASCLFAKYYLEESVFSKEELVKVASKFKNGCPTEGAAVHEISSAALNSLRNIGRSRTRENANLFERLLRVLGWDLSIQPADFSGERGMELMGVLYARHVVFCVRLLGLSGFDILPSQHSLDTSQGRDAFDSLPYGVHFLSVKSLGHAVVLIKTDFGTYLFDPNIGLIEKKERELSTGCWLNNLFSSVYTTKWRLGERAIRCYSMSRPAIF